MRSLNRNKKTIYYATVASVTTRYDSYGNETGSPLINYSSPTSIDMVLSGATGNESLQPFGIGPNYSLVAITDIVSCPIDEESILWVNASTSAAHDFEVVGVAKNFNSIKYALKEVSAS